MISVMIPVEGTFDIARGRNAIRSHIATRHWPVYMNARAATLFTALGDLIACNQYRELVLVQLELEESGPACGIRLSCTVAVDTKKQHNEQLTIIEGRLRQAADRLEIECGDDEIHVEACIFV